MGDIWPYGGPKHVTWDQVNNWMSNHNQGRYLSAVFAAIATAESGLDEHVVNDTPSTGDYSVGLFQINYYGSLRAGRISEFGTPRHLAQCGLDCQGHAAISIANSQGLSAWSTYNSGAYLQYMHGVSGTPGPVGGREGLPPHNISPPKEDWSDTIRIAANAHRGSAARFDNASKALRHLVR